ncbi:hypothetical protein QUF76_06225 [Desulfobacterales bacterium HSG16]|nr:hypothetical protein [Desulfobacterales bacterium HSG16]
MSDNESKTIWHELLGQMLEELLVPVGITVETDVSVMSKPPKADILLLRSEQQETWSEEQRERLPDGIRDVSASHVLLEFKYTESVNKRAILQTAFYDHYYRMPRELKEEDVRTFLISSKTPLKTTLARFGYEPTKHSGVYRSRNVLIDGILLILLNELSNSQHNILFKVFASRLKEKRAAYEAFKERRIHFFNHKLQRFLKGLLNYWFDTGGYDMKGELTPEKVLELGRQFDHLFWAGITLDDIGKKFNLEVLAKKFKPEDIAKAFKPEDIAKAFKPEDIAKALKPEDIAKVLKPEDRLKGLSISEIEKHLEKLKKKSN